jgi:predicted RNase H-like HicB family nuclease
MKNYLALVDKDPDSAFGIHFPDIPGCFSAADAAEDIVPNAVEALQLWAEDMPVPEPSSHEAIVALPDIRNALAEGGYLVSVPLIDNDSAVVRRTSLSSAVFCGRSTPPPASAALHDQRSFPAPHAGKSRQSIEAAPGKRSRISVVK